MKNLKAFLTIGLFALFTVTLMSCAEKKLDISKIEKMENIQNLSSSELDELIDQFEILVDMTNKDENYLEKFSKDDQAKIVVFSMGMAMAGSAVEFMDEADLTDEQCKPFTKKQVMRIHSIAQKISSDKLKQQ